MSIEFTNTGKNSYATTCIKHFDELWAYSGIDQQPTNSKLFDNPTTLFKSDTWKLEYQMDDGGGTEYFSVKNDEYWVNAVHHFNLDQFSMDSSTGELTFRKVPVDSSRKKMINVLKNVNADKLEGLEDGHIKVTYYRM